MLATSLIISSCLLQHNSSTDKDKTRYEIVSPNYLFCTKLNYCFVGATRLYTADTCVRQDLELNCDYRSTVHTHCSFLLPVTNFWFCRTILCSPDLILRRARNSGVLQYHFILSRFNTRRAPFYAVQV